MTGLHTQTAGNSAWNGTTMIIYGTSFLMNTINAKPQSKTDIGEYDLEKGTEDGSPDWPKTDSNIAALRTSSEDSVLSTPNQKLAFGARPIWPDYFARKGQEDSTNWHYMGYWSDTFRVWRAYYTFALLNPVKAFHGARHFYRSLLCRVLGEDTGTLLSPLVSLSTPLLLLFSPLFALLAVGIAKMPGFRNLIPPLFHPFSYMGWVNYCVMLSLVFSWHGYRQFREGLHPSQAIRHSSKLFWNEFLKRNLPAGHYSTEIVAKVSQGTLSGCLPSTNLVVKPISAGAGHRIRSMRWDSDKDLYICDDPERIASEAQSYSRDELSRHLEQLGIEMIVERWEIPRQPLPISSLRILTLNVSGKSELICAAFLPAPEGSISTAYFDLDTYLMNFGESRIGEPLRLDSDGRYEGLPIPELPDIIHTCLALHNKLRGHIEISWDVMLTKKGPVYLEGNVFPPGCDYKLSIFKNDANYNYLRKRVLESS